MFIEIVPNRTSPPAVLLRESWREGGKVKKRTLANLSKLPMPVVQGLRTLLKGGVAFADAGEALEIRRALPHGDVSAVLGTLRDVGLERRLAGGKPDPGEGRLKDLALAMIVARVIAPGSKLSTLRALSLETANSSLGLVLDLAGEDAPPIETREIYAALDWLGDQQERIEKSLAKKHLGDGTLVLYDVSSSYLEGRCCELARFGYSRDKRGDRPQIVYGLLCDRHGCPVAIEAFSGETGDPSTLQAQVAKLKQRFGLTRVVVVGDRGMITQARLREDLEPAGLDWITALRAPQIRALIDAGPLQLDLFDDQTDLAEITASDYPGERLVVCRNPVLAKERARKRSELLAATERALSRIAMATRRKRRPLRGKAEIGLEVGKVIDKHKMAKHFEITITEDSFTYQRREQAIAAEARLDGLYVIRSNLPKQAMSAEDLVASYKSLAQVERAFRSLKSVDLQIRPVYHWLAPRVRAHLFLCMLAYHVEWHMRERLKPILYADHDKAAAEAERSSIVAPIEPSPAAKRKARRHRTDEGTPLTSLRDLLRHLATLTLNSVITPLNPSYSFTVTATPTDLQRSAFELLGVKPICVQ
jgi:transposase